MCGKAPSPPAPQAPPAPIPKADTVLEGRANRQRGAAQGAQSGYQSTMLTEGGASGSGAAPSLSPVLGG